MDNETVLTNLLKKLADRDSAQFTESCSDRLSELLGRLRPGWGKRAYEVFRQNLGWAAVLLFTLGSIGLWYIIPPDRVQDESRVEAATLLPLDAYKASPIYLNSGDSNTPPIYKVTVTDIAYKLQCRVRTPRGRGIAYQIGRHRISPLGGGDRREDGSLTVSSEVQFGEQQGRDLFLIVLVDKDGATSHLAESLEGILDEDDLERLVEAADRPGVEATAREVIDSALRKAGWGDSPVHVLVVTTVEHTES